MKAAVNWALEAGYRHFDTAYLYFNEGDIGDTLQEWTQSGKIKREDLFITTKVRRKLIEADELNSFHFLPSVAAVYWPDSWEGPPLCRHVFE